MSKMLLIMLLVGGMIAPMVSEAQRRSEDPALRKAREETELVLDLGRLLGFIYTMTQEQPHLDLTPEQGIAMLDIMGEIRGTSRMTAGIARSMTARIENDILNAAQLSYTDRLWIAAEQGRAAVEAPGTGSAARAGAGSGGTPGSGTGAEGADAAPPGSLAAYAAGGPYNPMTDPGRRQAEDFDALSRYLRAKTGRR